MGQDSLLNHSIRQLSSSLLLHMPGLNSPHQGHLEKSTKQVRKPSVGPCPNEATEARVYTLDSITSSFSFLRASWSPFCLYFPEVGNCP